MKKDEAKLRKELGGRVRLGREQRELSQSQLADMVGTDRFWVSHIECGARLPSVPLLARLADALNTPAGWLLGLEEDAPW
jgi:transcriptional regulator with XRE-family HTH domain